MCISIRRNNILKYLSQCDVTTIKYIVTPLCDQIFNNFLIKLTSCDDGNQVLTNGFLLKIFSIKLSSLKFKLQQLQFQIKLHQN